MRALPETRRLQETRTNNIPWRKWGPYLSERQWGTVRAFAKKESTEHEHVKVA
jgi:hypothetical protein